MNVLDAVLNVARVKLLTNRPPLFPHFLAPFLPSLSLSLSLSPLSFSFHVFNAMENVCEQSVWRAMLESDHATEA